MAMTGKFPNQIFNTKFIIGCGTGRCGTKSLATILHQQPNTYATHEARPLIPWYTKFTHKDAFKHLNGLRINNSEIIADVCLAYGPHLESFLNCGLNVYIVILQRPINEVIESYTKKTGNINHWSTDDFMEPNEVRFEEWDKQFPKYPVPKRKAIELYCKDYEQLVNKIQNNRVKMFPTSFLGNIKGVFKILKFCNFQNMQVQTCHINRS